MRRQLRMLCGGLNVKAILVILCGGSAAQGIQPPHTKLVPVEQCPTQSDVDTVVEIAASKSQFETTEEFNRRVPAEIRKRLPHLKMQGAFCHVQVGRLNYDAEKRALK